MYYLQKHAILYTTATVLLLTNPILAAQDETGTGQTLKDMCSTDSQPIICVAEKTQALCAEAPDSQECTDAINALKALEK